MLKTIYIANVGSCHIERGASTAIGTPTYGGQSQTTYSCVAGGNCNYDVHVIGNYESNGHTGFRVHNTGNTNVNLRVSGPNQGSQPLVLVFVSYEPINWILHIPSGVVIDRILLVTASAWKHCVIYLYTHQSHNSIVFLAGILLFGWVLCDWLQFSNCLEHGEDSIHNTSLWIWQ